MRPARLAVPATLVVCAAFTAHAQVPTFTSDVQPYAPMTGGAPVPFTSFEDNGVVLQLPFSFPWFGASYDRVLVQTNGFLSFDLTTCLTGCSANTLVPSTAVPNNAILAWHDDLSPVTGGAVLYDTVGGEFVVEWRNVQRRFGYYTMNMQVRLAPSGRVTLHYGAFSQMVTAGDATVSIEGPGGTQGTRLLSRPTLTCSPTNQTGCCGNSSTSSTPPACTVNDVPVGRRIVIAGSTLPDLAVGRVTIDNLVRDLAGNLTFNVHALLGNFGAGTATGFAWRAFVSTDKVLDAGDQEVATGGPVTLGPEAITTVSAPAATVTPPPAGPFYVLVQVDPANVVAEGSETNNVTATADSFDTALDLVADGISGVASSGGGNVDPVVVRFRNRGAVAPGPVPYRILLSADTLVDAADFVIHQDTRVLTGGETVNESVAVTMPAAAPNGDFHYLLDLDPANALAESNEANNRAASTGKVQVRRADLVTDLADVVDPVTNLPTRTARFGEPLRATVRFANQGGANASNFFVGLVLSSDATLSLLSDTLVCEQLVTLAPADSTPQTVTLDCVLPLKDAAMRDFATGPYYLFLVVDSTGAIYESNKGNNNLAVGPVRVSAPGADLTVSAFSGPAVAGVGEVVPVVRTLRNVGNVDAPAVAYRYVVSANDIITPDDVAVDLIDPSTGQPLSELQVTLARGAADSKTELVRLPSTLPPGTWYLGCLVDPAVTVAELDRTNNALATAPVQVAPSALRVVTSQLPDATVGLPWRLRLAAQGEQGPSTWRVVADQGPAPAWLTLGGTDGTLEGTPDAVGVTGFTVEVENAGRRARARLALRVLPPTSQLTVTTTALPAVVNSPSSQFSFSLSAAGGVRPYTWALTGGTLPSGLSLTPEGILYGAPRGTPNGTRSLTFEVRDAAGSRVAAQVPLRLVAPGSIVFLTLRVADALVGSDYLQDIAVDNSDGSPLARPLTFDFSGALPDGLLLTEQSELVTLSGRPTQAGVFRFTLAVLDANGRADTMDYVLSVYPPRLKLALSEAPVLRPGQADVQLAVTVVGSSTASLAVVSGQLPPGLTLAADGALTGTVAAEGSEGTWTFVVEARDARGATGLSSFALVVEREPARQGCSSAGVLGPAAWLGLWAVLRGRRRRRAP